MVTCIMEHVLIVGTGITGALTASIIRSKLPDTTRISLWEKGHGAGKFNFMLDIINSDLKKRHVALNSLYMYSSFGGGSRERRRLCPPNGSALPPPQREILDRPLYKHWGTGTMVPHKVEIITQIHCFAYISEQFTEK